MAGYEYGVAYEFDENGDPRQEFVEPSDDERDAHDWAHASGDEHAKVVRRRVDDVLPWEVI
jgi:hypothetical protein